MPDLPLTAAIIGGSGYTGGELLRLLIQHPNVDVSSITSRKYLGKPVTRAHPNLRGATQLKFSDAQDVSKVDLLFLALPHGTVMSNIADYSTLADRVIDLSADFRLKNSIDYLTWYGEDHTNPSWLEKFTYGLPEWHREELKSATHVAVPGCTATSSILPLKPLVDAFDIKNLIIDAKVGSSAGGASVNLSTHHPERSGVVRSFKPSGHRHTAEMIQELDLPASIINFSPHAVELIRGILATCHVFIDGDFTEQEVWQAYLKAYGEEPFVRLVKERGGIYRFPEPKLVAGTNFCDIGFEKDPNTGRLIVMAAIDNLMKGAAGQAVQCMNLMCEFPESTGLEALGFHPL